MQILTLCLKKTEKIHLTLSNKFEFNDIMHLKEYPHFQFIFKLNPHDNTINITYEFSKLDNDKGYHKRLKNDVFISLEHNTDYSSFNISLKNGIRTSIDHLAINLQKLIDDISPLADCFD